MANRILVIDDDPAAVQLMKLSLMSEGYQVDTALTATEGLRLVQTERPDLIVLDIMMPDVDGIELCRYLRSQEATANTPIIFLTGKTQVEDKIAGLRAGADDYITKPADPREIVVRVGAVLARLGRAVLAPKARVIALIGAKGGVGTSTIAVNLGVAWAKRQVSTLLLDLHHHAGTIGSQLKLTTRPSLADLLALQAEQIDSRQVEKTLVAHVSGLRVLLSPSKGANLVELSAAHTGAIARSAAALADMVILDLPHMLSLASKEALRSSNMALMVLAPDPTTVACAEQLLPLLEDAGLGGEAVSFVIVNRAPSVVSLSVADIERRLGKTCLGALLPAVEELAFADRRGVPLALSETMSAATVALQEMTKRVHDRILGPALRPL